MSVPLQCNNSNSQNSCFSVCTNGQQLFCLCLDVDGDCVCFRKLFLSLPDSQSGVKGLNNGLHMWSVLCVTMDIRIWDNCENIIYIYKFPYVITYVFLEKNILFPNKCHAASVWPAPMLLRTVGPSQGQLIESTAHTNGLNFLAVVWSTCSYSVCWKNIKRVSWL